MVLLYHSLALVARGIGENKKDTLVVSFWFLYRGYEKDILSYINKVSNSNGFIQLQEIIMGTEFYSKFVVFNKLIQHLLDFT